jgi:hypothetical protein
MGAAPTPYLMNASALFGHARIIAVTGLLALTGLPAVVAESAPVAPAVLPTTAAPAQTLKDAAGRSVRRAPTGHITNYYEEKVPPYTLPDVLALQNGKPVRDAATWFNQRRPEILKLYATEIYGRVPTNAPKVTAEVVSTDPAALGGAAVLKEVVLHFGDKSDGPAVHLHLYLPAQATGPAPLVLSISFGFGPPAGRGPGRAATAAVPATATQAAAPMATAAATTTPAAPARGPGPPRGEPIADIIARGYGYAVFRYTEIQPDTPTGYASGVIGLTLAPGQTKPAPDEWGTISAWAWGLSRVQDYLETDRAVDAKRVAIVGHSRLGKTVLWAGAQDQRFAMIFSSQGGEMGSAIARRDFGETVDDMAANFGYQFAGNFQKYPGHWNDMPVDAHFLISLCAPRPLLVTGGSGDQWSDPHGEFLGVVAAGPVYRLLGQPDVGTTEMPPLDTPVITGKLAFLNHDGPHAITPLDWKTFLDYADKYLKPAR